MFRDKLFEDEDLKTKKIRDIVHRKQHHAPWALSMCLGHHARALGIGHALWAFENVRGACVILCIFAGLSRVFSPNPVRNSHDKY